MPKIVTKIICNEDLKRNFVKLQNSIVNVILMFSKILIAREKKNDGNYCYFFCLFLQSYCANISNVKEIEIKKDYISIFSSCKVIQAIPFKSTLQDQSPSPPKFWCHICFRKSSFFKKYNPCQTCMRNVNALKVST